MTQTNDLEALAHQIERHMGDGEDGWFEMPDNLAFSILTALRAQDAVPVDDWSAGLVDCDGNELVTMRADELQKLRDEREKFMWQVRDTCVRAEKAEALLATPEQDAEVMEGAELRVAIQRGLLAELGDTYDCTRVWQAWSVGTMDQDDFVPVLDRLEALIDTIAAEIVVTHPSPNPAPQAADGELRKAIDACHILMQEAKGAGGDQAAVTWHLDEAVNWLDTIEILITRPTATNDHKDAVTRNDWITIAKSAGKHGIRYRTNSALVKFLNDIGFLANRGEAV